MASQEMRAALPDVAFVDRHGIERLRSMQDYRQAYGLSDGSSVETDDVIAALIADMEQLRRDRQEQPRG